MCAHCAQTQGEKHIYVCKQTQRQTHIYVCTQTQRQTHIYVCTQTHICAHKHRSKHTYMCAHKHMCRQTQRQTHIYVHTNPQTQSTFQIYAAQCSPQTKESIHGGFDFEERRLFSNNPSFSKSLVNNGLVFLLICVYALICSIDV